MGSIGEGCHATKSAHASSISMLELSDIASLVVGIEFAGTLLVRSRKYDGRNLEHLIVRLWDKPPVGCSVRM